MELVNSNLFVDLRGWMELGISVDRPSVSTACVDVGDWAEVIKLVDRSMIVESSMSTEIVGAMELERSFDADDWMNLVESAGGSNESDEKG